MVPATPPPPPPQKPYAYVRENESPPKKGESGELTFKKVKEAVKRTQMRSAASESDLELPTPVGEETVMLNGEELDLTESRELTPEAVKAMLAQTRSHAQDSRVLRNVNFRKASSSRSSSKYRRKQR